MQPANMVEYRKPSFGNCLATAQATYWFGISRNVSFPGLLMDVDRYVTMVAAKDGSSTVDYMQQSGMRLSAFEHLVPEKLFTDASDPNRPQGVSAVKALALAASQGQKIYALNATNQANHTTLLGQINIDVQAKTEIQNALAAGKEVTTHASPITQSGWTGSGYIITDPATGAGAYKIAGGANGGALEIEHNIVVAMGIPSTTVITAYLGFAINYVANLIACYADEIIATVALLALIFMAIGAAVVLASTGGGAAIAAVVLALLVPQQASAAQSRDCRMDCNFASSAQLTAAKIYDPEGFKIGYGAVPTSRYDICACRDGAIAIFGHGQCGQMNALWEVCFERWK